MLTPGKGGLQNAVSLEIYHDGRGKWEKVMKISWTKCSGF
jgi:hypothetical protein